MARSHTHAAVQAPLPHSLATFTVKLPLSTRIMEREPKSTNGCMSSMLNYMICNKLFKTSLTLCYKPRKVVETMELRPIQSIAYRRPILRLTKRRSPNRSLSPYLPPDQPFPPIFPSVVSFLPSLLDLLRTSPPPVAAVDIVDSCRHRRRRRHRGGRRHLQPLLTSSPPPSVPVATAASPSPMRKEYWIELCEIWGGEKWNENSAKAKQNRAVHPEANVHTSGSVSFAMHKARLGDVSQCPELDPNIWVAASGAPKKGHVYGFGHSLGTARVISSCSSSVSHATSLFTTPTAPGGSSSAALTMTLDLFREIVNESVSQNISTIVSQTVSQTLTQLGILRDRAPPAQQPPDHPSQDVGRDDNQDDTYAEDL
ncbi:hypothetical protein Taro_025830 [Colocasia esculenta]|uniref:Uncharacterized protein n=1 Tax=Colocasia esculenta TaxID=4460 RepID=A0A843VFC7_COLES|nr:hypothetical protein [Colocasia esculenta]